MRFLLVEDEPDIADAVQKILRREKYVIDHAADLAQAREALRGFDYPLVILDRRLPDGDGVSLLKSAGRHRRGTRFLVVSALSEVDDLVHGLDKGADDYIVKPFEPAELLARIRALLRRPAAETHSTLSCGAIQFHLQTRRVTINENPVVLPRRELSVLEALMRSAGRVVTRESIEEAMYGYDDEIQSNTLEAHISRVRKLLQSKLAEVTIHTVRGVGYMMKAQ